MLASNFHTLIKDHRTKEGITQKELSKLTKIPQSHISKIENGEVDIRLSSLLSIASVLGVSLKLIPRKYESAVDTLLFTYQNPTKNYEQERAYALEDED